MYIVPLRVAQAEELFLGVLLQGVGKGGLCNIGMALTGFCVFLILGSKILANFFSVVIIGTMGTLVFWITVNSPTPTRRRIKSSRDVGELVLNPYNLLEVKHTEK